MTESLVVVDRYRAVLPDLELPSPPPTRIYISGNQYRIVSPSIALPPIANVIKIILNWTNNLGNLAKNIWFLRTSGGVVTSDPATLTNVANAVLGVVAGAGGVPPLISTPWVLSGVTAKDAGGTSAQANSTAAGVVGTAGGPACPPQVAVCISWSIAEVYRGGKPRTYVPGIPQSAVSTASTSQLASSYAASMRTSAQAILSGINTMTVTGGGAFQMGTVSYHSAHAVRPVPLFRSFISSRVHERLDSQRRRNGPESRYPTYPA